MIARRTRSGAYVLDPFRGTEKILYAVAVELWDGACWCADVHYVKAHTAAEARRQFLNTNPGVGRFVAVAPAVGFYALDDSDKHFGADPDDGLDTNDDATAFEGAA